MARQQTSSSLRRHGASALLRARADEVWLFERATIRTRLALLGVLRTERADELRRRAPTIGLQAVAVAVVALAILNVLCLTTAVVLPEPFCLIDEADVVADALGA